MANNKLGYDVISLYDDFPLAEEGKVDGLPTVVPAGKFGMSVTTIGTPGALNKPGEVSVGGSPETPKKPGGDVNIGGNK
jgi:hypothetical protein